MAARNGHLEILKLLENHGADLHLHAKARDSDNQYCALAMAAIYGHLDIVNYLEEKLNENPGEFQMKNLQTLNKPPEKINETVKN